MRILFVSNFYPPCELGGYEQNCCEVAGAFKRRGHSASVVTSNYRASGEEEPGVYRVLETELDLRPCFGTYSIINRARRVAQSVIRLESIIEKTNPDIIFVWGMGNLPRELLAVIERHPNPKVVYYVSDYWPMSADFSTVHWETPSAHPVASLPKRLLARFFLSRRNPQYRPRFEHAICVSRAVRDRLIHAGLPLEKARIIHNGIDTRPYLKLGQRVSDKEPSPMRIVYAGRLAPEKDLCTIITGFAEAVSMGLSASLTIVGRGNPGYVNSLHSLVTHLGVGNIVSFRDWVPREQIPSLLSRFNIFVSASVWEEPLSLSIQQAMAAGLVVIATPRGGIPEMLIDGENGFFFQPGATSGLAYQIRRLALEPGLRVRLSESGRRTVMSHFTIERMTNEIDEYFQEVLDEKARSVEEPVGWA